MNKLKVMTIFGTRPEAIKMAPVVLELQKYPDLVQPIVAVTAQHRQMLDQVLNIFAIEPDYDLDIMSQGQTLFDITSKSLVGLNKVFDEAQPDLVLVHGDTTTTFAGALAAFYRQIPVGHVEAGLRTGNKYSPFPEEMNRKLTGSLTDLHFAPTDTSKANLRAENVAENAIFVTGNTVIDALQQVVKRPISKDFTDNVLAKCRGKRIILVTTHRRENLGEPMRNVYKALRRILEEHDDTIAVFPIHCNPKVRQVAKEELSGIENIIMIEPMEYEDFAQLLDSAYLVMTDSGGIQEEAPSLAKPVLVLRDTTERPEAVQAGTVLLVGTDYEAVYSATARLLADKTFYDNMANACNPYGDGHAAERIVQYILHKYNKTPMKPAPFVCKK